MDVRPLRESPDFRRLWWGTALSQLGSRMTDFAVALQIFRLTGSSLAVGAVGLASALPSLVFGLFGGALVDTVDRRKAVLFCTSGQAGLSAVFAVQAFFGTGAGPGTGLGAGGDGRLWLLYALVVLKSTLGSVNAPARRTFMPRLLRAEQIPAGAALTMFAMHSAMTAGPLLAGLVAGPAGLKGCYLADLVSFSAALYGVGRLPAMLPEAVATGRRPGDDSGSGDGSGSGSGRSGGNGGARRPGLRAIGEALRFLTVGQVLRGALLADVSACVLAMPTALFPQINAERFGGGSLTLGVLSSSLAIGGVLGSTLSGHVGRITRPGRGMLVGGAVWGLALAGFGMPGPLWAAVLLLVVAGAADANSVVFRTSIIQAAVPDRMRGRVNSVEYMVGAGTPQLGDFRAGAVASVSSPGVSAVTGGLAEVIAVGLMWLLLPGLVRYRAAVGSGQAGAAAMPAQAAGTGAASPETTSTPGS
ncbi:MFS transporter [Phaeacidiphilus oryzae]|uniref:MFS transporter n=1 Tax=Phaeacidiphilus oryzae TaxID=348818 RepID=UPI00068A1811|nr:MFS transporter [Phaeacidiphilus oryzae]